MSKAANVSSNVNLEWMMMLRNRKRGAINSMRKDSEGEEASRERRRARRSDYSPGMVPRVYYKETDN